MSGEAVEAAVAILRVRRPDDSILLIRRATNPLDPWSGHWSFPGGRRDPSDTDLLDTALRELQEECGITLRRDHLSTTLPVSHAGRRVGKFIYVQPYVFELEEAPSVELDPGEAAEAFWLPSRTVLDIPSHQKTAIPGFPTELLYPGIALHGAPLWGFTYRVLCGWLGVPVEDS